MRASGCDAPARKLKALAAWSSMYSVVMGGFCRVTPLYMVAVRYSNPSRKNKDAARVGHPVFIKSSVYQ
jgi:hypothetical protein